MYRFFHQASKSKIDDGVIDYQEFCYGFRLKDNEISQKLFRIFDINSDDVINFRELVQGIHKISSTNIYTIIEILYRFIDQNNVGYVTDKQVCCYIAQLLALNEGIKIDQKILENLIIEQFEQIALQEESDNKILESDQENQKSVPQLHQDSDKIKDDSIGQIQFKKCGSLQDKQITYTQF